VEGFGVAVLPGGAWLHVEGTDSGPLEPGADDLRDELGCVVRANAARHASDLHDADEFIDHVLRGDAAFAEELRALPDVLVDQGEPLRRRAGAG